ncbi:hypothetical protein E4U54_008086 [Claviceps lovelessii]|nr:hypothetical protein E4U54_008086 [Claviceps lovelessii]
MNLIGFDEKVLVGRYRSKMVRRISIYPGPFFISDSEVRTSSHFNANPSAPSHEQVRCQKWRPELRRKRGNMLFGGSPPSAAPKMYLDLDLES